MILKKTAVQVISMVMPDTDKKTYTVAPVCTAPVWATLFFILLLPFQLHAETLPLPSYLPDTAEYFPSHRFEGGAVAFYHLLQEQLYFPETAARRGIIGTAIVAFTVSAKGQLADIYMVNSLHPTIDRQLMQAIKTSRSRWRSAEGAKDSAALQLFLPVTYILNDQQFLQNFEKPYYLGNEMIVKGAFPQTTVKDDQYYASRANEHYQQQQYQEALQYLHELIRRNPYNKEMYLMRGHAYYQLGDKAKSCRDFHMIRDFLRQTLPAMISVLCP